MGLRCEWLAAAAWLVARVAMKATGSVNPGDIVESKMVWLGAVLAIFKLDGADTGLDCHVKDILKPLMPEWHGEPCVHPSSKRDCLQRCWKDVVKAEYWLCHQLDFQLLVPVPGEFRQALRCTRLQCDKDNGKVNGSSSLR